MSIIACPSCGKKYDGSGMQAGVKFQCTDCGAIVQVGGGPRPAAPGKRAAGRAPTRKVPGRGPAGGGGRPTPGGRPMPGGMPQQRPGFAPPQKSSNTGLYVGLGVGAAMLLLIVVVVAVSSGGSSEEDAAARAEREAQEREAEIERRREETTQRNEEFLTTYNACLDTGSTIESALRDEDASALSSMFDWDKYATYNHQTMGANQELYANDKMAVFYGDGEWEKNEEDRYTGKYTWSETRDAGSLQETVTDYFKEYVFGAPSIRWVQDKSKLDDSRFGIPIDGTRFVGHRMFYDVDGTSIEFWVGAERGSTNVKILNFVDKSAFMTLQQVVMDQNPAETDDRQRDPYNPDRDPGDTSRDPRNPDLEGDDRESSSGADNGIPELGKTGRMPSEAALVNAVNEVSGGLNQRRLQNVREEPSVDEKHATMGAFIDKLIDAHNENDRRAKFEISSALYKIWDGMIDGKWSREELVYDQGGVGSAGQSTSNMPIRRWLSLYEEYLEIMGRD